MLKIESENEFLTSINGHNSGLKKQNLPIYNPKPLLLNINSLIQSLKKIGQKTPKKESGNKLLMPIKGHNSRLNWRNLPIFNPKPLLSNINLIQSLKKIGQKMLKIESGNKFLTSIKGHNSRLNWRNLPIYNPKPLLPNINSFAKFEENRSKKMIKIESGNEVLTDGRTFETTCVSNCPNFIATGVPIGLYVRTDGRTLKRKFLNGGYNLIPHTF